MEMSELQTAKRVYLRAEQLSRLKELADAADLSVSWLIRRAIDEYLARHASQQENGGHQKLAGV